MDDMIWSNPNNQRESAQTTCYNGVKVHHKKKKYTYILPIRSINFQINTGIAYLSPGSYEINVPTTSEENGFYFT